MKNIDTEVTNFHQKMAKSMHNLIKAFNDGFEAVEKSKKDEAEETEQEIKTGGNVGQHENRVKQMEKTHSGLANLEALTSQLKLSFNEEKENGTTTAVAAVESKPEEELKVVENSQAQAQEKEVEVTSAPISEPSLV